MRAAVPLRIGVHVFDGADELDVVGAYMVFSRWAAVSAIKSEVVTFCDDGSGVRLASGMRIVPDAAEQDVEPVHVLVYPGGPGAREKMTDPAHLEWLRRRRRTTALVVAVRDGALVLAAAGLLAGRAVATNPDLRDRLASTDPSVLIDTDAELVDDGDVVTARGSGASLGPALHVVERLDSLEAAVHVRESLDTCYQ